MDLDTRQALNRAGLQLVDLGEAIKEIAEILGAELVDVERCRFCGGMKTKGQACGCFQQQGAHDGKN